MKRDVLQRVAPRLCPTCRCMRETKWQARQLCGQCGSPGYLTDNWPDPVPPPVEPPANQGPMPPVGKG